MSTPSHKGFFSSLLLFIITHIKLASKYNIAMHCYNWLMSGFLLDKSPNIRNAITSPVGTFAITTIKCNKQMGFDEHIRSKQINDN